MKRATTICCSFLALAALAKPPEPIALLPLRAVWRLALNSHLTYPPAYAAARAFFPIEGDRLVAYDVPSGKQLWLVEAKPAHEPVAVSDFVFVAEAGAIVALHAADGSPAWRLALDAPLVARPTAANGWLLAATKAGGLLAVRASDGTIVWQRSSPKPLHAPPTITADRVYAPMEDGRIVAHALETGEPVWEHKVGGEPNEILAVGERLFSGSTDNFLYCLLAKDGRIDWRWRTGGDISKIPVADSRRVYFVSFDNVLRALDQTSGGQYWMKPLPFRPVSGVLLSGMTLVVAGQSPTIKTFAAKDGAPGLDIAAGDEVSAPPALLEERETHLPMIAIVARHIVNGDSVTLQARSMEPALAPFMPLANPVTPVPMPATRP